MFTKEPSLGGTPKLQRKRGASHSRIIEKEMVLPDSAQRKAEKTLLGSSKGLPPTIQKEVSTKSTKKSVAPSDKGRT